jgi:hypothetical protein
MFISMQGNWTINVKSKDAAFPQRFIVIGAATGNGTYNGVVGAPAVTVTGNQWLLAIQNNPGSGFRQSDTRIKFPAIMAEVLCLILKVMMQVATKIIMILYLPVHLMHRLLIFYCMVTLHFTVAIVQLIHATEDGW